MARPPSISDETILEAARDVFLERGVRGTSAEVAARAGVSEGILFKRYGSKEALFHAAMAPRFAARGMRWLEILEGAQPDAPLEEVLVEAGEAALAFFAELMPLVMMQWSSRTAEEHVTPSSPPMRARARAAAAFAAMAARGALRSDVDTSALAHAFTHALFGYALFATMFGPGVARGDADTTYVRALVRALLHGTLASAPASNKNPSIRPRKKKPSKKRPRAAR